MDILKIRGISLFIVAFLNLILALLLWKKSKNDKAKIWLGVTALFSGLYAFLCGGTYFFWNPYSIVSIYWWRSTWLGILTIPSFNIFTYYFTGNTKNLKIKATVFYLVAFIISYFAITTNLFAKEIFPNEFNIVGATGSLDFLGRAYILLGLLIALTNLFKKYFKVGNDKKSQLKYFIWGTSIFTISVIIIVSILPFVLGWSPYYDIPAFLSFVWVAFTTYAILKYNLFNIRVFASELLTFGVWILLFVRTIFSVNFQDLILNIILAISLTIIGVLFLRSVYKENELNKKLLEDAQKNLDFEQRLRKTFAEIAEEQTKKIEKIIFNKIDRNLKNK
ncbi:MAG: histidine kinase N-terminal 7TM domain-containing protein [bacterium]